MSEKDVRKSIKTRCYYSDYVNHMIRFFLSTPDTLQMAGKRKPDVDNWLAVQSVWHKLSEDDKSTLTDIYKAHYKLPEGVRIYCSRTGADPKKIWVLVTKVCSSIAKRRGLV